MRFDKSQRQRKVSQFLERLAWRANPRPQFHAIPGPIRFKYLDGWRRRFSATKKELVAEDICINP